jgi:predicted dehydrogenase
MSPVRFGLVGYGFGGRYFHAPLLAAAPECEFVGVVTTCPPQRHVRIRRPARRLSVTVEASGQRRPR